MKKIFVLLLLAFFGSALLAQDKSRGVSRPGSIGRSTVQRIPAIQSSDISCGISFQEPSGDRVLSEGESGVIIVRVENLSRDAEITPKLEISVQSSWAPTPRVSSKWMEGVQPGQTGEYNATIKWDEKLPSGSVTYKVKAIDFNSGVESSPVEVSFDIGGKGTVEAEPVFVNVDETIPRVPVRNSDAIAVIIGNKSYTNRDVPNVDFADNDAAAVKKYLVSMLGYREDNIVFVQNIAKSDFERIFGTRDTHQGRLYNMVKPGKSDVLVYYSGHGAPDMKNKKAYFMPSNCDPNYVQIDGYPLDVFYGNLEKIPARSVTVILDACFSGGSQQGMLIKNASPMYIEAEMPLPGEGFNLFTSASGDQISSWYPEAKHSLFTYYFLRAIRGEADKDRNRRITVGEIRNFIDENVPYMARRKYGREQTPVVKGNPEVVISTY